MEKKGDCGLNGKWGMGATPMMFFTRKDLSLVPPKKKEETQCLLLFKVPLFFLWRNWSPIGHGVTALGGDLSLIGAIVKHDIKLPSA